MKNLTIILTMTVITLVNTALFSQGKTFQNDEPHYYYSASNGDAGNPMLTTTPNLTTEDPAREHLVKQLNTARENNDVQKVKQLQNQLNEMNGESPVQFVNNPSQTGIQQTEQQYNPSELDGISTVGTAGYWAIATQTSNRSTVIFNAVSEYVPSSGDQIKVYASYDLGVNWVLKGVFDGFTNGVRLYNDELDIEPVITPTDTLLYAVAGYVFNGNRLTLIARFDIKTGSVNAQTFSLSATSTRNYGPRLVSDNSYYTYIPYIYVTVCNDTLVSANNHKIRQRFCMIQDPLNPVFHQTHKIATPSSSGFCWSLNNAADTIWMWQDIGYYHIYSNNGNAIYTTCIFRGWNNVYNAWSNDYGTTISSSMVIQENNIISKVKIAFTGGDFQSGSIVYLKNYSTPTGDVDVRFQNTANGGTTLNSFVSSYVEFSTDTAVSCDIQAVKGAYNKFKIAYSTKNSKCYYTANWGQNLFVQPVLVNNIPAGLDYGRVRAGYRIAPTDTCLAVWSGNSGNGMYCTYACTMLTGVSNQNSGSIPRDFSLEQNYPNPFNPSTTIKFSIPENSHVKLVVYDITGKEAAVLVDKSMQAGNYNINFNASHLASGVYFYRIDAGEFKEVKKMMLVK